MGEKELHKSPITINLKDSKEETKIKKEKKRKKKEKKKSERKGSRKELKKQKKRTRKEEKASNKDNDIVEKCYKKRKISADKENTSLIEKTKKQNHDTSNNDKRIKIDFDYKYILAPMVGASELAFRILCRKYGTQVAYTPMISSAKFAVDPSYREQEFQTIPEDRPLVCHFSANNPKEFATSAKLVEDKCDAIDLNLGCPQRTAYVGHFGSYLLGDDDRDLVLDIIRAGSEAVSIPIFVKIRLLNSIDETIQLCQQLRDAGASLIAVHARYRASFERNGPGARDGPALLDQVLEIKKAIPEIPIIANGNVVTYDDVVNNLRLTQADGIMSAEGILDNPALFLPSLGNDKKLMVSIADPSPIVPLSKVSILESKKKQTRKLQKKLREISLIEDKLEKCGKDSLNEDQEEKLKSKASLETALAKYEVGNKQDEESSKGPKMKTVELKDLIKVANNKVDLANEYLSLARKYPVKIRSIIFHTRRICKELLNKYQLMENCVSCQTIEEVQSVLDNISRYIKDPSSFLFDNEKAKREKEALLNKKREEGKRKAYEARMMRKAKREGKDSEHYLRQGADVPTLEYIGELKKLTKEHQLKKWKLKHSQHCMAFHLEEGGCKRDRTCAFLHVDAKTSNTFDEIDEVAG